MRTQVLMGVSCFVGFAAIVVLLEAVGAPWWSVIPMYALVVGAQQVYCELFAPRGARARLLEQVDPTVGPPPGAAPVDLPVIRGLDELSRVQDWDALRSLLSDDFEFVFGKRRYGQRVYIRILKMARRQLRGERRTDEVVVDPHEPDVVWVRSTSTGKPRFGPGFVETSWTRVSLTVDGNRVREIANAGVLCVA